MAGAPEFEFSPEAAPEPQSMGAPEFEFGAPLDGAGAPSAYRAVTPRRIGEFISQVPGRLEQTQQQAEGERLSREAGARMELGPSSEGFQRALAGFGSAADTMTGGVFPYIPAAVAKGAGKLGVPGYERYADMPIVEAKKEAERKVQAAATLQPGAALTGQVGGIAGGAALLPAIAPSAGPAVSGALTGALYGGISGAAKEGDIYEGLKGAGLGAVLGGVGAPIIERTLSGLTRLIKGGKPVITPSGDLTPEAMAAAKAAGLSDDEVRVLGPHLQQTFERRGVTPEAAKEARFAEFGMQPSRGMVTGDVEQLAREKAYGTLAPLGEQAAEAARRQAGGTGASLADAVSDAVARGSQEAAKLKTAYQAAYKTAEDIPGKFDREAISGLGERIRGNWALDAGKLDFYTSDLARKAAADLDSVLGAQIAVSPGVSVTHQTFRAVESGRKILNGALSAARTPTDRAAIRKMVEDFDDRIEASIANGAFSGDPNVVNQWKTARKLWSEYQNKYGVRRSGEEAGTLMKQVLDGTKSADDVANMMFNFSGGDASMKQSAVKVFLQLRRALGPNAPELEQIKKSYVQQLMTPAASGERLTPKDFMRTAQQIEQTLRGRGASFARMALSPDERASLDRYAKVMRMAGSSSPSQLPEQVNKIAGYIATAAPLTASGAGYLLSMISPTTAAIGAALSVPGAISTVRNAAPIQSMLAGRAPPSIPNVYRFPEVRTGLPLATGAAPEIAETAPPVLQSLEETQRLREEPSRVGRATGGAVNLSALAKAAKKHVTTSTQDLLNEHDDTVAKALEVANRHI